MPDIFLPDAPLDECGIRINACSVLCVTIRISDYVRARVRKNGVHRFFSLIFCMMRVYSARVLSAHHHEHFTHIHHR